MKKLLSSTVILCALLAAVGAAQARDTKHVLPIDAAMAGSSDAKEGLDGTVKFFFGKQRHPAVITKLGGEIANRKTNAFGKSDAAACNWAFLSALVALEKSAKDAGANAVVDIVSYYKKNEFSSETEYECHAGGLMAGVALKGNFVKIGDK